MWLRFLPSLRCHNGSLFCSNCHSKAGMRNVWTWRNLFYPKIQSRRGIESFTGSEQVSESLHSLRHLPQEAEVVICGGGIVGTSVAYHLVSEGMKDVTLLEQGSLTCGATWHAAGLITSVKNRAVETKISAYSIELYKRLHQEGHDFSINECGSLHLARTRDRFVNLKRQHARSRDLDVEAHILSPADAHVMCPIIETGDLLGGLWVPGDISISSGDLCVVLAKLAKEKGVKIIEGCKVLEVQTVGREVSGVVTNRGKVKCRYFVNAAGQWSRHVGSLSDPAVAVPVHACREMYLVTKPLEEVGKSAFPVVWDYDGYVNLSEWSGGVLIGGVSPQGRSAFDQETPADLEYHLLEDDWDNFQSILSQALHRMPLLQNATFRQMFNGAEAVTPDGKWIIGEAPEVKNYFVACGMCAYGITGAGGIGRLIANWILHGEPDMDMWSLDLRRFLDIHNNARYLQERAVEANAMKNKIAYPRAEHQNARKLRTSPLYTRQAEAGAWFGEKNGFERAMFFRDPDGAPYPDSPNDSSTCTFHKPGWFDLVEAEYWACREGVALIDMSSFTKFEIKSAGREVVDFLQYMCANNIDVPVGTVVHTGMLNEHGGYENDCSVARMADNCYFIIAPTSQQTRSYSWLSRHLPKDRSVLLGDVHSMYTALDVVGPKTQELLSEVADTDVNKSKFGMMTCKEINIGNASGIRAMRYTHTGEDGFMLYIPSEYALHVYDTLMSRGENYGIRNAGYFSLRALRIEKFFAYWGVDITPSINPYEAGREFRVDFTKNFIGKEALLKVKEQGHKNRLVHLTLENHNVDTDPWSWGGEPVYRNNKFAGTVTSSVFGYTLGQLVCLAVLFDRDVETGEKYPIKTDWIMKNCQIEVDVAGTRFQAKPSIYPPSLKTVNTAQKYVPKTLNC